MPLLATPDNLPAAPFVGDGVVFQDTTLRQTIRTSVGGQQLRLRFSNAFGGCALPITKVSVALPRRGQAGVAATCVGSSRMVTFHGRRSVLLPVGTLVVSDPVDLAVDALSNLTVTVYLAQGQQSMHITAHPGSRTTSFLTSGDHVDEPDLVAATPIDHWYFLSGLEVLTTGDVAAAIVLGDSLTDGRGSTTNANDRWPDRLAERLARDARTAHVAVLGQATGGNRVLNDGLGPSALARLDRDVLAHGAVRWLVMFEGTNDIGTAKATPTAQRQLADDLIAAYEQIIVRAHARGIVVYGATLPPFGGNTGYDDPDGLREQTRQTVNRFIRSGGRFDDVIDFDRATQDPADPRRLLRAYDGGDHIHLSPIGYQALADAVPPHLFHSGV